MKTWGEEIQTGLNIYSDCSQSLCCCCSVAVSAVVTGLGNIPKNRTNCGGWRTRKNVEIWRNQKFQVSIITMTPMGAMIFHITGLIIVADIAHPISNVTPPIWEAMAITDSDNNGMIWNVSFASAWSQRAGIGWKLCQKRNNFSSSCLLQKTAVFPIVKWWN